MSRNAGAVEVQHRLSAPFSADYVQAKPIVVSGNRALAAFYIDARAVMDRLDDVVGAENWKDDYEIALSHNVVICRLSVRINGEWLTKVDVGVHVARGEDKKNADDLDKEYKGVVSDSFKRAAVKWGIGRYLYDVPSQWYDFDPQKKRFTSPPRLPAAFLPRERPAPAKPDEAIPAPAASGTAVNEVSAQWRDHLISRYRDAISTKDVQAITDWAKQNKSVLDAMIEADRAAVRQAYEKALKNAEENDMVANIPYDDDPPNNNA